MTVEAPQFVKISLNDIEIAAPIERGSPEFEQAAILQTAAEYALKGMQGFFKIEGNDLWGFAFTDKTIDPKAYVLGILQDGYLEDALPMLEAMSHTMQDDESSTTSVSAFPSLAAFPNRLHRSSVAWN